MYFPGQFAFHFFSISDEVFNAQTEHAHTNERTEKYILTQNVCSYVRWVNFLAVTFSHR